MRRILVAGARYDRLTLIYEDGRSTDGHVRWRCRCDCGVLKSIVGKDIGRSIHSCGCLQRELTAQRSLIHGEARRGRKTAEYHAWRDLIRRCEDRGRAQYKDYGGRGITVCRRWRVSYANFLADVGRRPAAGYSIERRNNHRGYGPGNCGWATRGEQGHNKRNNIWIEVDGIRKIQADWSRDNQIPVPIIIDRRRHGWSDEEAVTTPVMRPGQKRCL
jgi:hypothetical protein